MSPSETPIMAGPLADKGGDDHVCKIVAGYVKTVTVSQSITVCRGEDGSVGIIAEHDGNQVSLVLFNDKARALAAALGKVLAL